MRPVILFILLGSFVGVGRADELPKEFNNGTDSHVDPKNESLFHFSEPTKTELAEWNEETRTLKVFIPIPCEHQWEKSDNYLMVGNGPHVQFSAREVEVCAKCDLIRINPKDLKK